MKQVLLFVFISFHLLAQNKQINTFQELLDNLSSGQSVRAIIDYSKCDLIIDSQKVESPKAIGGMNFDNFEFFDVMTVRNLNAFISVSESVLISHPRYGYVINYVKLRIYDNQKVEIVARYLDPKTIEVKMDETFRTELSSETNKNGLKLFINN